MWLPIGASWGLPRIAWRFRLAVAICAQMWIPPSWRRALARQSARASAARSAPDIGLVDLQSHATFDAILSGTFAGSVCPPATSVANGRCRSRRWRGTRSHRARKQSVEGAIPVPGRRARQRIQNWRGTDKKSHSELRTSCNPSFFQIVNHIEYGSGCCEKKVVLYLSRDAGSRAEAAQEAGGLIAEEMLS
jgi:hypothetical protein